MNEIQLAGFGHVAVPPTLVAGGLFQHAMGVKDVGSNFVAGLPHGRWYVGIVFVFRLQTNKSTEAQR